MSVRVVGFDAIGTGGQAVGRTASDPRVTQRQARRERRGVAAVEAEFTAFYERHAPRIVRTVALVVRDAALAEEAVAEAFARAWARWPQVSAADRPDAWVTRVAINECHSRFRRRRVERRKAHAVAQPDTAVDPEPPASDLWQAVGRLPEQERTLIALRYIADLRQTEIADLMGIPAGTVASGLNRGRRRLGIDLRPDHEELS